VTVRLIVHSRRGKWKGGASLAARLLVAVTVVSLALVPGRPPTVAQARAIPQPVRHVVILSIDGARADATRAVISSALLARAAYSWTAQTTLPSSTLPAHTSMLTGVPPAVHGMRSNPDNPRGYIQIPTVFSVVTQNGGRAAAFVNKRKLLFLVRPGTAARAEYLPYPRYKMLAAVQEATRYLVQHEPRLLFIHVADPDAQGHRYGWTTEPYIAAMRQVSEAVSAILDVLMRMGRLDDSLVIVTADHGGRGRLHGGSSPEETTVPWLAFGAVQPGPIIKPVMIYDTAATAVAALGLAIPRTWLGAPVVQIVEKVR